jgi:hypothetical protein
MGGCDANVGIVAGGVELAEALAFDRKVEWFTRLEREERKRCCDGSTGVIHNVDDRNWTAFVQIFLGEKNAPGGENSGEEPCNPSRSPRRKECPRNR